MGRYTVAITQYEKNPHARCFEDFARAMADALRAIGHEVVPSHDSRPGRLIIFGANNITDPSGTMPEDAICYNSEQVSAVESAERYINPYTWKNRVVWDYSDANMERLRALGIKRIVRCPVGYIASMTKIKPADRQDIDVLFYGSENARRRKTLARLSKAGLNVVRLFNVYGADRDDVIARAKIVLNLHYYEHGVFEIFRTSHLFANRKCVVTEGGGRDANLEEFAARAAVRVDYDQIADVCCDLVEDDSRRREAEERGFSEFSKIDLVDGVRRALEAS